MLLDRDVPTPTNVFDAAMPPLVPSLVSSQVRLVAAIAPGDDDDVLRLAWARSLSWAVPLVLCTVIDDDDDRATVATVLAARVRRVLPADANVAMQVRVGDPGEQILACAHIYNAGMIVLGQVTRREGLFARLFRPSVPTAVVRAAPCPILLVRAAAGTGRILIATDLTDPTWPTLHAGAAEHLRTHGEVTVLHCIEPSSELASVDATLAGATGALERAAAAAELGGATLMVEFGPASSTILEEARAMSADLIVVGTHGRRGLLVLLGSTAEDVIRGAACDVLVVRITGPEAVAIE